MLTAKSVNDILYFIESSVIFANRETGELFTDPSREEYSKLFRDRSNYILIKGYLNNPTKIKVEDLEPTKASLDILFTMFPTLSWEDKRDCVCEPPSRIEEFSEELKAILGYFVLSSCIEDYLEIPSWVVSSDMISRKEINLLRAGDPSSLARYYNIEGNEKIFRRV